MALQTMTLGLSREHRLLSRNRPDPRLGSPTAVGPVPERPILGLRLPDWYSILGNPFAAYGLCPPPGDPR